MLELCLQELPEQGKESILTTDRLQSGSGQISEQIARKKALRQSCKALIDNEYANKLRSHAHWCFATYFDGLCLPKVLDRRCRKLVFKLFRNSQLKS